MVSHSYRQARTVASPMKSIPKGWYWVAALGISLTLWWGIFKVLGALLRSMVG